MGAAEDLRSGRTGRDSALAAFEERKAKYLLRARRAFVRRLLDNGTATVDEIHDEIELPASVDPKLFGATPTLFAKSRIIERVTFRPALRPEAHARPVSVWRLIDRSAAITWLQRNPESPIPETGQGDLFASEVKPSPWYERA